MACTMLNCEEPGKPVLMKYGPYESQGVVKYRTDRLKGLIALLTQAGHVVALEKSIHWSRVALEISGEEIFRCQIEDLFFGGDGELDPVCQKALKVVNAALFDPMHVCCPWHCHCECREELREYLGQCPLTGKPISSRIVHSMPDSNETEEKS